MYHENAGNSLRAGGGSGRKKSDCQWNRLLSGCFTQRSENGDQQAGQLHSGDGEKGIGDVK